MILYELFLNKLSLLQLLNLPFQLCQIKKESQLSRMTPSLRTLHMFVTYLICCHQLYVFVSFYYGSLIAAVLRHIHIDIAGSICLLSQSSSFFNFIESCLHHFINLQIHILYVCVQISFICFSVKKNKYHASMLHLSLCFFVSFSISFTCLRFI